MSGKITVLRMEVEGWDGGEFICDSLQAMDPDHRWCQRVKILHVEVLGEDPKSLEWQRAADEGNK